MRTRAGETWRGENGGSLSPVDRDRPRGDPRRDPLEKQLEVLLLVALSWFRVNPRE